MGATAAPKVFTMLCVSAGLAGAWWGSLTKFQFFNLISMRPSKSYLGPEFLNPTSAPTALCNFENQVGEELAISIWS